VFLVGKDKYYTYVFQIFVASINYRLLICGIDAKAIGLIVAQNDIVVSFPNN
jgi:hypothetical protein